MNPNGSLLFPLNTRLNDQYKQLQILAYKKGPRVLE